MTKSPRQPEGLMSAASDKAHDSYRNIVESLVVPTFVLDVQGQVIIWNRACERLTGLAAAEVIGTSNHWRCLYDKPHPTLADLILQGRTDEIDALYAEHGNTTEARYGLSAENWCDMPRLGTRLYLMMDAGPIYDEAGNLIAVVETFRDMTAQKQAQLALQQLASCDGLTAIANRRCFNDTLQNEWRHAMRELRPLSLLLVDVDNFKRYNDTYGHLAGDECLKCIAGAMASNMRANDLVARYGGEEFAIILPNQSDEGAAAVAERIRSTVAQLGLPDSRSDVGYVTVSIGVATVIPSLVSDPHQLVAAADAALYCAKYAGRNRVSLSTQNQN
jgi:diguanylate cyclase (GGDEF)-like protein/PAS domain S-box-containing protein